VYHKDLETERNRLVDLLIEYRKRNGYHIVVVFDGWKAGGGTESSSVRGGVKIVYSRLGEKADSVIKRIISTERREWIVVSSDREIASHAWSLGSTPLPSEEFIPFLRSQGRDDREKDWAEGEDDEEENAARTGNPKRLSKRERAVRRALGKL
jgi:predicted RNA-binding protein with PIN domain